MLDAQLEWIETMSASGLNVPGVFIDRSGARVHRVSRRNAEEHPQPVRHALLLDWVHGRPANDRAHSSEMADVGAFVADAHNLASQVPVRRPDRLPRWDWNWVFGPGAPVWTNGPSVLDGTEMAVVERAAAAIAWSLDALGAIPDTQGMIHRDLKLENLILGDHGVGMIDFDHTGVGYYLHDLAVIRTSILNSDRTRSDHLWAAVLAGYTSRRQLPRGHPRYIQALRALQVAASLNRSVAESSLSPDLRGPPSGSSAAAVTRLAAWLQTAR